MVRTAARPNDGRSRPYRVPAPRDKAYLQKHLCERIQQLLDLHYWNEADGIYYGCRLDAVSEQIKVKTPATFWPMLAGLCSNAQAEALAHHAADPEIIGGERPWPSVARNDPDFMPTGCYWRGGIWLPTAYAGTKALEQYGYHDLADIIAEAPDSVRVTSTLPYTLVINGKRWPIQKGTQILKVT